jgi:hypothetical protein
MVFLECDQTIRSDVRKWRLLRRPRSLCSGCEIGPPATVKKCSFSETPSTTWQHTSTLKNPHNIVPLEQASNVFDRSINVIFPECGYPKHGSTRRGERLINTTGENVVLA